MLQATGPLDIGQAVVVQQGIVLGLKPRRDLCLAGTLRPVAARGRGGVMVKLHKPGQETWADMPSIGPDTVAAACTSGLAGIAVGAGATLVLDRDRLIAAADAEGLFVTGIRPDDYVEGYDQA